jgi:hypothetical protein
VCVHVLVNKNNIHAYTHTHAYIHTRASTHTHAYPHTQEWDPSISTWVLWHSPRVQRALQTIKKRLFQDVSPDALTPQASNLPFFAPDIAHSIEVQFRVFADYLALAGPEMAAWRADDDVAMEFECLFQDSPQRLALRCVVYNVCVVCRCV